MKQSERREHLIQSHYDLAITSRFPEKYLEEMEKRADELAKQRHLKGQDLEDLRKMVQLIKYRVRNTITNGKTK